ncbi:MAG: hypothetical protein PHS42_08490 [Sulfurimonas sp.]|nr:hypothetical protein [Sulfurimonas sp.]MDD3835498.1 hypothetical protein [Sulfurimonas sp.]
MRTLKLNIDDSIFEKFMGLLDILPKEKISISEERNDNSISFEEAQIKVQNAINNISNNEGLEFNKAFEKVLNS